MLSTAAMERYMGSVPGPDRFSGLVGRRAGRGLRHRRHHLGAHLGRREPWIWLDDQCSMHVSEHRPSGE